MPGRQIRWFYYEHQAHRGQVRPARVATGFGLSCLTFGCLYVPTTCFFPSILTVRACFPLLPLLIAEGLPVGFTEGEEWFWFVLCACKGFGRTQRTELQTQSELAELRITCCRKKFSQGKSLSNFARNQPVLECCFATFCGEINSS